MVSIRVTEFGGLRDRDSRNVQSPGRASVAKDVKLWSGSLSSWRYPGLRFETEYESINSVYKFGCNFIVDTDPCVSLTYDPQCKRVFRSAKNEPLRWAILPDTQCDKVIEPEWFLLGVPKPTSIPQIISSDPLMPRQGDDQVDYSWQYARENRTYGITYVNSLGEESTMSVSDQNVDIDVDGSATIGFFLPAGVATLHDITTVRIYRGLPLFVNEIADNSDPDAPSGSAFFLVGEIEYTPGQINYVDDLPAEDIGEAYVDHGADMPIEGLENITMTDSGSLVASDGKHLWFSEPFNYHAWNCFMNFDHCIEAIGVVGNSIYLATNANAYVLQDTVNESECRCCRSVATINEPTPIASKHSFVVTPTGVMFATHTGLVRITGEGMQYISLGFYTEDQWQKWLPHQLVAAYFKGAYYATNGDKGFIFDVREGYYVSRGVGEASGFTEMSLTPNAMYVSKQNELIMTFGGNITAWDESDTFIPYTWRSSLFVEGGTTNIGYGKIVFSDYIGRRPVPHPVMFKLIVDDKVVFQRRVQDSTIFTLPRGYESVNFHFEIEGIQEVMEVHLASTKRELTLISNT